MSALDAIRTKLKKYPQVRFVEDINSIVVLPVDDSGFPVSFFVEANEYVVGFDGWHEHFESEDEAYECFALGLSDVCRLRVERRGDLTVKWTAEHNDASEWRVLGSTGLLFVPFWRKKSEEFLTNGLFSARE